MQQMEQGSTFSGLKWKLYTASERNVPSSFFLFETTVQAEQYAAYIKKQAASISKMLRFTVESFGVLETMSRLTRASIDTPPNSSTAVNTPVEGREQIILLQVFFKIPRLASCLSVSAMDRLYPKKAAYHLLTLPGLIWKIWGTKEGSNEVSGFYLFDSREHVNMRIAHVMEAFPQKPWISDLRCETFLVDQERSRKGGAPIDLPSTEILAMQQK